MAARRPFGQHLAGDYAVSRAKRRTNAAGAALSRQLYYPFGQVRWASESPLPTDFTYTGQRNDAIIGLHFYNARYYPAAPRGTSSAALGRFVQADTIVPNPADPQSLNRYSYVYNNALRYVDPSGHGICDGQGGERNPDCRDYQHGTNEGTITGSGRYIRTTWGWFDTHHFNTGHPDWILEQVRRIAGLPDGGSAWLGISQSFTKLPVIKKPFATYVGLYEVSTDIEKDEITGVALGIYMHWSMGFELWEGELESGFAPTLLKIAGVKPGRMTSFALEDLPSHYLGFVAATMGFHPKEATVLIEKYLGGGVRTDEAPPEGIMNLSFHPLTVDPEPTLHPWPDALYLTPITPDSGLWAWMGESTYPFSRGPGSKLFEPFEPEN